MKLFVENGIEKYKKQVDELHKKKFTNWGGSYSITNIPPDQCIFNYSNYVLNKREEFLLSLGINFCIPFLHYPKKELLLHFEYLLYKLQGQAINGNNTINEVVNEFKVVLSKYPSFLDTPITL